MAQNFVDVTKFLYLLFPLIVGGILHMVAVTLNILPKVKIPIHINAFGENKTWRGFLLMPLFTWLGLLLLRLLNPEKSLELFGQLNLHSLGIYLGIAYVLAELPNSWIKRRLKIKPGEPSQKFPWLFAIIDQADSGFGCAFVYWFYQVISFQEVWLLILFGTFIHLVFNLLLYGMKLRKNPL
jgi:CDP-diglyceride synthetase